MITPPERRNAINIVKEIPTDGHRPLLVMANDYRFYYVKSSKRVPDFTIISEFVCHYLLRCWEIETPEIAAITVDRDLLPVGLSEMHRNHHFDRPCFASLQLDQVVDLHELLDFSKKYDTRDIINADKLPLLGLFDIWVENDDRKPSNNNLLLATMPAGPTLFAIDQSFTFSTMAYNQLNPKYVSSSFNDSILLSSIGTGVLKHVKIDNKWVASLRDMFYLCVERCKNNFDRIVTCVPPELGFTEALQAHLARFLFNEERNKMVFDEFLSRILI